MAKEVRDERAYDVNLHIQRVSLYEINKDYIFLVMYARIQYVRKQLLK